ncbi:MAG: pH regulation protein F [Chromatiales bacterium]|nr:pH regulation protein F [Gammaproteobacteria bacterium]MBW6477727.1 pH regulation protein F [Chromatiales bacterium]
METLIELIHLLTWIVLSAALGFGFVRLVRGPSLPDRVVALELFASITVGVIAAYVLVSGVVAFLDVAMVLALTAFLTAVAFARYLEKGGSRDE